MIFCQGPISKRDNCIRVPEQLSRLRIQIKCAFPRGRRIPEEYASTYPPQQWRGRLLGHRRAGPALALSLLPPPSSSSRSGTGARRGRSPPAMARAAPAVPGGAWTTDGTGRRRRIHPAWARTPEGPKTAAVRAPTAVVVGQIRRRRLRHPNDGARRGKGPPDRRGSCGGERRGSPGAARRNLSGAERRPRRPLEAERSSGARAGEWGGTEEDGRGSRELGRARGSL
jgi:hypothetical protein